MDRGQTKHSLRDWVYGIVDELNSLLGLVLVSGFRGTYTLAASWLTITFGNVGKLIYTFRPCHGIQVYLT